MLNQLFIKKAYVDIYVFFRVVLYQEVKTKTMKGTELSILMLAICQSISTIVKDIFKDSLRIHSTLNSLLQSIDWQEKEKAKKKSLLWEKEKTKCLVVYITWYSQN